MSELRTLRSLVDAISERGDQPAVLALHKEEIERWSYAELADQAWRLASGLSETGVCRGQHVALLAANRPEWIAACLAVIGVGGVVVPLDVQLGDEELRYALDDSDAGFIFATSDRTDRLGLLVGL
ncbi:MAG: long-chain fatty acid--CoA ligase [Actinomycetota bacterium]|nr:long-chain fatty acid--CoA ligase [Actinomycetota bacterium]